MSEIKNSINPEFKACVECGASIPANGPRAGEFDDGMCYICFIMNTDPIAKPLGMDWEEEEAVEDDWDDEEFYLTMEDPLPSENWDNWEWKG